MAAFSQLNSLQGRVAAPDPFVLEVASGPLLFGQPVHGGPRLLGAAHVRQRRQRLHSSQDFNRRLPFPARIHQAAAGKQAASCSKARLDYGKQVRVGPEAGTRCNLPNANVILLVSIPCVPIHPSDVDLNVHLPLSFISTCEWFSEILQKVRTRFGRHFLRLY